MRTALRYGGQVSTSGTAQRILATPQQPFEVMTPLPPDVAVFVRHLLDIGFFVEPIEVDDSQSVAFFKFNFSQFVISHIELGEKKFIELNEHAIGSFTDVEDLMERLSFLRNVPGDKTLHLVESLEEMKMEKKRLENAIGEAKPRKRRIDL